MAETIIGMGSTVKKVDPKELEKKLAEETSAKEKLLAENKALRNESKKLAADLKKANETIESLKTEGGSDNGTDSKDSSGGTGKSKDKK